MRVGSETDPTETRLSARQAGARYRSVIEQAEHQFFEFS